MSTTASRNQTAEDSDQNLPQRKKHLNNRVPKISRFANAFGQGVVGHGVVRTGLILKTSRVGVGVAPTRAWQADHPAGTAMPTITVAVVLAIVSYLTDTRCNALGQSIDKRWLVGAHPAF